MRRRRVPVLALQLWAVCCVLSAVTTFHAVPAGAGPAPSMSVTPDSGLADGDEVSITVSGLEPGTLAYVEQCEAGAATWLYCDHAGFGVEETADGAGNLVVRLPVYTKIYTNNGEIDCRATPCDLGLFLGPIQGSPTVAVGIAFDPSAPERPAPAISADPVSDLRNGDVVRIVGSGLRAFDHALVVQCAARTLGSFGQCNPVIGDTQADADGNLTVDYEVRVEIGLDHESQADCRVVECSLVLLRFDSPEAPDAFTLSFVVGTDEPLDPGPQAPSLATVVATPRFTG